MGAEQTSAERHVDEVIPETQAPFEVEKPQDECGVYAAYAPGQPVLSTVYNALHRLQHRGQSGAGIAYFDTFTGQLDNYGGTGKVHEAIPDAKPDDLGHCLFDLSESDVALGHVRYSTANNDRAIQPVLGDGFALAHNGHIEDINLVALEHGVDTIDAASDSHALTQLLSRRAGELGSLDAALDDILPKIEGAFSLTITDGQRVIGVRDPWGFRPLVLGELPYDRGKYVLASEESAFKATGAELVRDIGAGEIINISAEGVHSRQIDREEESKECMFEYIYFARPWETVNGVRVYSARRLMGRYLQEDHPVDADMVVAVPNSGRSAAAGYAESAGLPNEEGIFVEEGTGRTFIMREGIREEMLDDKHIANREVLEGKSIVLVDDSVIKGSTMKRLVKKLRKEGGVKAVHVRSAAPPYVSGCYAGMDTRDLTRLVARGRPNEEIAKILGVESIAFNSVGRVHQAINESRRGPARTLCDSCASGNYPFRQHSFAAGIGRLALPSRSEDQKSPLTVVAA